MGFLIFIFIVAVILITIFAVVGYIKTKKEYASFVEEILSKSLFKKADILEIKTEGKKSRLRHSISFEDHGTITTNIFNDKDIDILYDLKNNAKPYMTFRYLNEDVVFPRVKTWVINQGMYNVKIHLTRSES